MCYITYSFIKRNEWGNPLFIIEWGEKMELLESIKEMVLPLIEQNDCYLDDIEYVKDNNEMYLRIYIEKNEGYLDMDTCVAVSEKISEKLDLEDPIKGEYYLEVSSPGLERVLRKKEHFLKQIGNEISIKLFKAIDKEKELIGVLKEYNDNEIILEVNNININIDLKNIALAKTIYEW